jgi:hypothetical protein
MSPVVGAQSEPKTVPNNAVAPTVSRGTGVEAALDMGTVVCAQASACKQPMTSTMIASTRERMPLPYASVDATASDGSAVLLPAVLRLTLEIGNGGPAQAAWISDGRPHSIRRKAHQSRRGRSSHWKSDSGMRRQEFPTKERSW